MIRDTDTVMRMLKRVPTCASRAFDMHVQTSSSHVLRLHTLHAKFRSKDVPYPLTSQMLRTRDT